MAALPSGCLQSTRSKCCLLLPLLPALEDAVSSCGGHQADFRSVLDVPKEQHTHHMSTEQTCRGENTGKIIVKMCFNIHNNDTQALQQAEQHLFLVTKECSLYKSVLEESRQQVPAQFLLERRFVPLSPHTIIAPASNNIMAHYSFDFAQQVHYPSNPLQPGPIYFLTPRKAAIFGVCCEAILCQVNFIIDEASDTGKGANTVVSMLDFSSAAMALANHKPVYMLTTVVARITPWCSTSCGECSLVCTNPSICTS